MTSSTASLNAISARFSSGSRRTLLGTLLIRHRSARPAPDTVLDSLYEACPLSQKQQSWASRLNYQTDTKNQRVGGTRRKVADRTAEPAPNHGFGSWPPFNTRCLTLDSATSTLLTDREKKCTSYPCFLS